MSGVTTNWAIPYSQGSDIANTIDDTDLAQATRLDRLVSPHDSGVRASRPAAGKVGQTYRTTDSPWVVDIDTGTAWMPLTPEVYDFSGQTQVDIAVNATDRLVSIDFEIQTTARPELRLAPNGDLSAAYYDVRDGSYLLDTPSVGAIAPTGNAAVTNGMRVAMPPFGSSAGGVTFAGHTVVSLGSGFRTCVTQCAVASLTGSADQAIESQNIAAMWRSAAAVTYLRLLLNSGGGSMTGRVSVTRA